MPEIVLGDTCVDSFVPLGFLMTGMNYGNGKYVAFIRLTIFSFGFAITGVFNVPLMNSTRLRVVATKMTFTVLLEQ